MDHHQATQHAAVEKYLLDELTPELREEFEAHFFDCQECALDLRATDALVLLQRADQVAPQKPGRPGHRDRAQARPYRGDGAGG